MKNKSYSESINSTSNKEVHLFAAANTNNGFVSFFEKTFCHDGITKIYILKGGPGCGKSTLMKKYAASAKEKGLNPIYYHCSSDPDSLDGVTVKETGICILDGTSPHAFEPSYPGVRDFYVDLSPAWDKEILDVNKDKIISLSDQKKECYRTAYRLLNAAGKVSDEMYETAKLFVDHEKIKGFVRRFAHKYIRNKSTKSGRINEIMVNAVSSKGDVRYFTPEKYASNLFFIKDARMSARFLLDELTETVKKSGASAVIALSPEAPQKTVAILLPENRICISLYDAEMAEAFEKDGKTVKIINASRFIKQDAYKQCRQKYRFAEKCRDTLRTAALSELSCAGAFHAELEKIYISATNYEKVSEIGNTIS